MMVWLPLSSIIHVKLFSRGHILFDGMGLKCDDLSKFLSKLARKAKETCMAGQQSQTWIGGFTEGQWVNHFELSVLCCYLQA